MAEFELIPDDQQENEDDISAPVSFKDAVVLNADWTIETINLQIQKGNIDLQPGFQRRVAWDDERKSRLIESIIVGLPVPNIVLAENKDSRGKFIVIDGKQRLVAVSEYMQGTYKLKGLDMRPDLNSKAFNDLPQEDREHLENATIRSSVIRNWKDENFLYVTFFRLNSGSLPLSPQELRKALIGGNLISAIDDYMLGSTPFKAVFGDGLDKRMRDSELVLRFVAYDRSLADYRGDFKEFLDNNTRYFEDDWDNRSPQIKDIFQRLDTALDAAHKIFGQDAFKKWIGDKYERVINRAVFDCISRFFAQPDVAAEAIARQTEVVDAFKAVCQVQAFKDSIEKTPKTVTATFQRVDLWGEQLAACLGKAFDKVAHRIV
ncbi:DUF262 domain-containing protein [Pseudomonas citronellolis]|uniref:DUF262 domain-containing protein n=1 Tax=Pseudomonas citronellolis TaxID=53408 RepID=UPI0018D96829|nr:DUF262 domain-containing protein [Pseudomonas citronellolis]MBH3434425.1 DUF262 domain-containing protein [Pseudomonas citronellolis]